MMKIEENPALRLGVNLIAISLVLLAGYLAWRRLGEKQALAVSAAANNPESPFAALSGKPADVSVALSPFSTPDAAETGISRQTEPHTDIPNRPRSEVITYTVKTGDNLFTIAEGYGLKPETLLWGNYEVLKDDPHLLKPDQVLYVLPTDGTYYQWKEGDKLDDIASFFKVDKEAILSYSGNQFDLTSPDTITYGLQPGQWLIIPGGVRELKDWGPPAISRSNPAVARYYGPGACGAVYEGAMGTGGFVWPTTYRGLSGYHYSAMHRAIDIGGAIGNAVSAADSGVVVYAGWSNYGYGNLIVIDHGNGWQTAYAHLSAIGVTCGQSVYQGGYIGAVGSTGNSSGPHLHFELVFNGSKPNPMDYLR